MAEKKENTDYNPDDLDRTTDHANDGTEPTHDYEMDNDSENPTDHEPEDDTNDDIRPEDSVSNISAPATTTSIARSVRARRVAIRLQKIDEEIALADEERKTGSKGKEGDGQVGHKREGQAP